MPLLYGCRRHKIVTIPLMLNRNFRHLQQTSVILICTRTSESTLQLKISVEWGNGRWLTASSSIYLTCISQQSFKYWISLYNVRTISPAFGLIKLLNMMMVDVDESSLQPDSSPVSIQTHTTPASQRNATQKTKNASACICNHDWLLRSSIPIGWRLRSLREK